jgi:hypothetical protein
MCWSATAFSEVRIWPIGVQAVYMGFGCQYIHTQAASSHACLYLTHVRCLLISLTRPIPIERRHSQLPMCPTSTYSRPRHHPPKSSYRCSTETTTHLPPHRQSACPPQPLPDSYSRCRPPNTRKRTRRSARWARSSRLLARLDPTMTSSCTYVSHLSDVP